LGWSLARFFFDKAEQWRLTAPDGTERPLTHTAGLVFCGAKAPIHRVTGLAHDLADLIKDSEGGRDKSHFGCLVLESFDHIGRDLEGYLADTTPPGLDIDPVRCARLPAAALATTEAAATSLTGPGGLSRRQIARLSRAASLEDQTRARALFDDMLRDLPDETRESLQNLITTLGGEGADETARLVIAARHLDSLWDYLAPRPHGDASNTTTLGETA
jgi:hypothetical protein